MDSQRLILFVALSFVSLMIFEAWQKEQFDASQAVATQTSTVNSPQDIPAASADSSLTTAEAVPADAKPVAPTVEERLIRVRTDKLDLTISTKGGQIVQAGLIQYPVSLEDQTPFPLMESLPQHTYLAQTGLLASQGSNEAPNHYAIFGAEGDEYVMAEGQDTLVIPMRWVENGIEVVKTFTFTRGEYLVHVDQQVNNRSGNAWTGSQYRQLQRTPNDDSSMFMYTFTGGVYLEMSQDDPDGKYTKLKFSEIEEKPMSRDQQGGWVAMMQHYYVTALVPETQDENNHLYTKKVVVDGIPLYGIGMSSAAKTIADGASDVFHTKLYIGPKEQERLEHIAPKLDLTVDYGIFTVIAKPIFWVLKHIHAWVGNWGVAIILITLLIKLLFYKLSASSYRSMAKMRAFAPELQKIKERAGDDRQKASQEMMKLYQKEKINPVGGCLPMLVQIPVFISLYWTLMEAVELRQAPFILWIQDLSVMDPYFILPIIMAASMYFQHKLNPTPMDPVQQQVFKFLPFIFGFFFAFFPAGLVLYWATNNILSIAQQWYITRKIEAENAK